MIEKYHQKGAKITNHQPKLPVVPFLATPSYLQKIQECSSKQPRNQYEKKNTCFDNRFRKFNRRKHMPKAAQTAPATGPA